MCYVYNRYCKQSTCMSMSAIYAQDVLLVCENAFVNWYAPDLQAMFYRYYPENLFHSFNCCSFSYKCRSISFTDIFPSVWEFPYVQDFFHLKCKSYGPPCQKNIIDNCLFKSIMKTSFSKSQRAYNFVLLYVPVTLEMLHLVCSQCDTFTSYITKHQCLIL